MGGAGLEEALGRLGPAEGMVIAVDQFEEVFTLGAGEAKRARFLDRLAAAAREPERRAGAVRAAGRLLWRNRRPPALR